jgi:hypothetical protein
MEVKAVPPPWKPLGSHGDEHLAAQLKKLDEGDRVARGVADDGAHRVAGWFHLRR